MVDSVADGSQVILRPLSEGEHEVVISIPVPETITVTYQLMVVSGGDAAARGEPGATPTA